MDNIEDINVEDLEPGPVPPSNCRSSSNWLEIDTSGSSNNLPAFTKENGLKVTVHGQGILSLHRMSVMDEIFCQEGRFLRKVAQDDLCKTFRLKGISSSFVKDKFTYVYSLQLRRETGVENTNEAIDSNTFIVV